MNKQLKLLSLIIYIILSVWLSIRYSNYKHYILYGSVILLILYMFMKNHTIENMASLPNEAIQNIASIYNGEMMTVKNLKITGNLTVDGNAEIGPAYIGAYAKNNAEFAQFSHKDKTGGGDYAVLHQNTGDTYINATNDRTIWLRNNNLPVGYINKSELSSNKLIGGNGSSLANLRFDAPNPDTTFMLIPGGPGVAIAVNKTAEVNLDTVFANKYRNLGKSMTMVNNWNETNNNLFTEVLKGTGANGDIFEGRGGSTRIIKTIK